MIHCINKSLFNSNIWIIEVTDGFCPIWNLLHRLNQKSVIDIGKSRNNLLPQGTLEDLLNKSISGIILEYNNIDLRLAEKLMGCIIKEQQTHVLWSDKFVWTFNNTHP